MEGSQAGQSIKTPDRANDAGIHQKITTDMNILLTFNKPETYDHIFESPKPVKVGALLRKGEDEQCVEFELPTGSFTELQNMIRIHFPGWRFVESWPIQDAAKLA